MRNGAANKAERRRRKVLQQRRRQLGNANGRFDRGGGKRIRLAHRARDVTVNSERCLIKLNLISTYGYMRYCQARRLDTVSNLPKSHGEVKAVIGSELQYDTITHTGQAWDQYDRRLGRFEYGNKLVNPNVAMELIAKVKPVASKERIVQCDGGGSALGHPRVFINLDKPGNHACGYCGLRFYNENAPSDGSDQIEV
ncbi:putative NADH dehydrogenase [ubiquinone] iron-sulfur protein 6, mitochondrial [Trichinella sp. T6]|nr:putative NADH dehydrogenase [ubiquinone] iron-sulfur protein 6, mitochondrial [Trichinella sp. T6]